MDTDFLTYLNSSFIIIYKEDLKRSRFFKHRRQTMAIIALARQVAAFGDEVGVALAEKLNYKFVKRTDLEKRIVELGFPESKMPKYDERSMQFWKQPNPITL